MRLFVHREEHANPEAIEADGSSTVGDLIGRAGLQNGGDADVTAWLEDADEPLDRGATLDEAGLVDGARLHVARRKKIEVSVRYAGETKTRDFRPNVHVQRVFKWAVGESGFDLPATERAKHTLAVCGAETEADRYAHVGSLASGGRVCFDLAPKARYQG
ncbi:hypothetical protein [Lentzea albidocapillata]|uniref:Uncharacterized protein n=1 Tax=Lentzea albidocapillata TaxID=40571 RepID=A0A1W2FSC1_9PSEU|nr:hypothetical protein [Lentzea albidocapillata]SMD24622.1 hypothetical protein SAMN05660733_07766 [Lentzea albidocapillata]